MPYAYQFNGSGSTFFNNTRMSLRIDGRLFDGFEGAPDQFFSSSAHFFRSNIFILSQIKPKDMTERCDEWYKMSLI